MGEKEEKKTRKKCQSVLIRNTDSMLCTLDVHMQNIKKDDDVARNAKLEFRYFLSSFFFLFAFSASFFCFASSFSFLVSFSSLFDAP